jgi:hypothetical protein
MDGPRGTHHDGVLLQQHLALGQLVPATLVQLVNLRGRRWHRGHARLVEGACSGRGDRDARRETNAAEQGRAGLAVALGRAGAGVAGAPKAEEGCLLAAAPHLKWQRARVVGVNRDALHEAIPAAALAEARENLRLTSVIQRGPGALVYWAGGDRAWSSGGGREPWRKTRSVTRANKVAHRYPGTPQGRYCHDSSTSNERPLAHPGAAHV